MWNRRMTHRAAAIIAISMMTVSDSIAPCDRDGAPPRVPGSVPRSIRLKKPVGNRYACLERSHSRILDNRVRPPGLMNDFRFQAGDKGYDFTALGLGDVECVEAHS
jgi:hypothetical protein